MSTPARIAAWRPGVPGVREVLHARFDDHAYPMHTHDTWTLLLVDAGAVRYDLDRHEHGALGALVTLLPPHVPHDGRSANPGGFRKRVLYLEPGTLDDALVGAAVDSPALTDPVLRRRVGQLHEALGRPGDVLEGESRLALIRERLVEHLAGTVVRVPAPRDASVATRLRDLLDERFVEGVTLGAAAAELGRTPEHLVRAFAREYGLPPHAYLTGRRVDRARALLLAGATPADAAVSAGFYDQSHLTRHLRRMIGVPPGRYRNSRP